MPTGYTAATSRYSEPMISYRNCAAEQRVDRQVSDEDDAHMIREATLAAPVRTLCVPDPASKWSSDILATVHAISVMVYSIISE
jgi:hypothetical protein